MKPAKTWMHAALRAQEVHTLHQRQQARDAWDALLEAAERERQARSGLGELSSAWVSQRGAGHLDAALDAVYRDFHVHLRQRADLALGQRADREGQWEATKLELQRTHSTQRLLERLADRLKEAERRDLSARETSDATEAWLLGSWRPAPVLSKPASTESSGGADDSHSS